MDRLKFRPGIMSASCSHLCAGQREAVLLTGLILEYRFLNES